VAELALLDKDGKTIEQSWWTIAYVSSEEAQKERIHAFSNQDLIRILALTAQGISAVLYARRIFHAVA
jgi:hypothetical protein